MQATRVFLVLLLALLVASCASDPGEDLDQTELEYYESSQTSLRSGNYQVAIAKLQRLESRFPFGRYAEQAQLELIFAYYKSGQAESARTAADRFVRLHPQHPNADYALYLRGMASFEEDQNFLERFLPLDPAKRDPSSSRESFNDFSQLVRRYPDSKYAPDAQRRLIYLKNLMAAYEIHVARYYIKREAYVAAANRARYVFEKFQGTPSVPDALTIMVEAYTYMGMPDLAKESTTVLSTNYPEYGLPDKSGRFTVNRSVNSPKRSWLNIITFGRAG
jgi:outer membrane protein assembly factor BamD